MSPYLSPFQSLDNLGSAEEVRSKRHSTSELGNITYSDVRREGWLHFKQILTEKGKVGTRRSEDLIVQPSDFNSNSLKQNIAKLNHLSYNNLINVHC